MIGVEFDTHEHAAAVEWACFQRGLLTLEAGQTVVRISPPLVLTEAEAATGLRLFGEAVAEVAGKALARTVLRRAAALHARPSSRV